MNTYTRHFLHSSARSAHRCPAAVILSLSPWILLQAAVSTQMHKRTHSKITPLGTSYSQCCCCWSHRCSFSVGSCDRNRSLWDLCFRWLCCVSLSEWRRRRTFSILKKTVSQDDASGICPPTDRGLPVLRPWRGRRLQEERQSDLRWRFRHPLGAHEEDAIPASGERGWPTSIQNTWLA